MARMAAQEKKIHDTWVADNKVFIKQNDQNTPKRIWSKNDLPA
jgi:hypothetical protein